MSFSEQDAPEVDISPVLNALIAIVAVMNGRLEHRKIFEKGELGELLLRASEILPTIEGASQQKTELTQQIVRLFGEVLGGGGKGPRPFKLTLIRGGLPDE